VVVASYRGTTFNYRLTNIYIHGIEGTA
jgi:hypothetical protein